MCKLCKLPTQLFLVYTRWCDNNEPILFLGIKTFNRISGGAWKFQFSSFLFLPHVQIVQSTVYWQRNNHMINYDDSRRDVSIETTPGARTQSRLTIREPQPSDSGNYTCSASNTEPASIYVFVSKGMWTKFVETSDSMLICYDNRKFETIQLFLLFPALLSLTHNSGDTTAAISRRNTSSDSNSTFHYILCISLSSFVLSKR